MQNTFIIPIITSSDPIMSMIYWIGLIVCIAAGYTKGKNHSRIPFIHYLLNCFGGGITRDVIILNTTVWFFTVKATPDILFALIIGFIYALLMEYIQDEKAKTLNNCIISFLDYVSLGSFIAIGADKAFDLGYNTRTAIFSAYVTSTFGGVLANFLNPLANITTSNIHYHTIVFIGSTLYCHFHNGYIVCVIIPIIMQIGTINYTAIIKSNNTKLIICCSKISLDEIIRSFKLFFARTHKRTMNIAYLIRNSHYPRTYLALHRLRIC